MNRKQFIQSAIGASLAFGALTEPAAAKARRSTGIPRQTEPRAIAMWDFSWLERRWPGGGYEDWEAALDGLAERGYNAVRIDAYPHLVAVDATKEWTLLPAWTTNDWGSPDINRVRIMPALTDFVARCAKRGIRVAFSCWYREDPDKTFMRITSPEIMADNWIRTLEFVERAGLLENLLYVDLCNEWPLDVWAPFFNQGKNSGRWDQPDSVDYMKRSMELVHQRFPDLPLVYSFCNEDTEAYLKTDLSFFDLFEQHLWMVQQNNNEFYSEVGYHYERFDLKGYRNLVLHAEQTYRSRPDYWNGLLVKRIQNLAEASRAVKMPLVTTECWAIVDYKDWPLLDWGWVKEVCALGVATASGTGQWAAMATSNFCGPQFVGMWHDVKWHQDQTKRIKTGPLSPAFSSGRLYNRL